MTPAVDQNAASAAPLLTKPADGRPIRTRAFFGLCLVGLATAVCFGLLYNRETSLSYSIGYNLYGAERILRGEVPYRDFHTLYPPATVYLNAALFRVLGTTLASALLGVMVFKLLTTCVIYLTARQVVHGAAALIPSVFSILWLRPNGPFKAVPMHYGALFLALSLYCVLRYSKTGGLAFIFACGVAVGILTLFKHNIGAYAGLGYLAFLAAQAKRRSGSSNGSPSGVGRLKHAGVLIAGSAMVVLPVVVYMKVQGALGAMAKTLFLGPGEFLVSRLAAAPSPLVPLMLSAAVVLALFIRNRMNSSRKSTSRADLVFAGLSVLVLGVSAAGPESWINELVFYSPIAAAGAGLGILAVERNDHDRDFGVLGPLVVAAVAAFMEAFPRFAREQAVAAMPFVALLTVYLAFGRRRNARPLGSFSFSPGRPMLLLTAMLTVIGFRLFAGTYLARNPAGGVGLRSNTALTIPRGKGVYFPEQTAEEIDRVTQYIQREVPEGGYFFPQSYAGSSFLFLANRENPGGAQFWGGVGVTDQERLATLGSLDAKHVNLIVTSPKDLASEKYEPMRRYIDTDFQQSISFGDIVILERNQSQPNVVPADSGGIPETRGPERTAVVARAEPRPPGLAPPNRKGLH